MEEGRVRPSEAPNSSSAGTAHAARNGGGPSSALGGRCHCWHR